MIKIKNRYSGAVIKEVTSLRDSDLSCSDLSCSDLRGSNLRASNLSNSDLSNSDLRGSIGNGKEVKSLQIGTYMVSYHKDILNIGCQSHTLDRWISFTDEEIDAMDKGTSLAWWKLNKDILVTLVKREIK